MKLRRVWSVVLPPLAPLLIAIVLAEAIVRLGWIEAFLMPTPSSVMQTLWRDRRELLGATVDTATGALVGFALSAVSGVLLAFFLASGRWVKRALYPYAVFFQTVPIIAIAPLLVIWFGFGLPTVIASAFIVSVFPMVANTLTGLLSVDPALRDLFRLYGAGVKARLVKLSLPWALPSIFTGLRIAGGLAVIGAIVGEFIAGGGLGGVVDAARTQQRVDKVFAAVLLAAALGLVIFAVINLASRVALRHWHASETSV